jgi:hypothetical protein
VSKNKQQSWLEKTGYAAAATLVSASNALAQNITNATSTPSPVPSPSQENNFWTTTNISLGTISALAFMGLFGVIIYQCTQCCTIKTFFCCDEDKPKVKPDEQKTLLANGDIIVNEDEPQSWTEKSGPKVASKGDGIIEI